jgi:putative transcriptional regulator
MISAMLCSVVRLFVLLLVAALAVPAGVKSAASETATVGGSLAGQFLVASAQMPDPRFAKTVIYMINHNESGAMGLVVNRSYGRGSLRSLLEGFGVEKARADETVSLHYGGPVEQARGFVLHSTDYAGPSTQVVAGQVALSTSFDILKAMATGDGPRQRVFLLGYAGWGPGQLEGELARDDWLTAPADAGLIFSDDQNGAWEAVLRSAGTPL